LHAALPIATPPRSVAGHMGRWPGDLRPLRPRMARDGRGIHALRRERGPGRRGGIPAGHGGVFPLLRGRLRSAAPGGSRREGGRAGASPRIHAPPSGGRRSRRSRPRLDDPCGAPSGVHLPASNPVAGVRRVERGAGRVATGPTPNRSRSMLTDGYPRLDLYDAIPDDRLFQEMRDFASRFQEANRPALEYYSRRWVDDPLHHWSRRWEYLWVTERFAALVEERKGATLRVLDAGSGLTF